MKNEEVLQSMSGEGLWIKSPNYSTRIWPNCSHTMSSQKKRNKHMNSVLLRLDQSEALLLRGVVLQDPVEGLPRRPGVIRTIQREWFKGHQAVDMGWGDGWCGFRSIFGRRVEIQKKKHNKHLSPKSSTSLFGLVPRNTSPVDRPLPVHRSVPSRAWGWRAIRLKEWRSGSWRLAIWEACWRTSRSQYARSAREVWV